MKASKNLTYENDKTESPNKWVEDRILGYSNPKCIFCESEGTLYSCQKQQSKLEKRCVCSRS